MEACAPGGEPLTRRTVTGLCVGFAGIVLLVWPRLSATGGGRQFLIGVIALQGACIGGLPGRSTRALCASGRIRLPDQPSQMLFGGLVMLALGTIIGEWSRLTLSPRSVAAEMYLIVVGSWVGYSAFVYALQHLPISTVSLYAYVNPVNRGVARNAPVEGALRDARGDRVGDGPGRNRDRAIARFEKRTGVAGGPPRPAVKSSP
jgi:drug/metabolite transporter (DMT)-like permease